MPNALIQHELVLTTSPLARSLFIPSKQDGTRARTLRHPNDTEHERIDRRLALDRALVSRES